MDIEKEIKEIKAAQLSLHAAVTVSSIQTAVFQIALAKVVAKLEPPLLDGVSVQQWLQVNIGQMFDAVLLQCPDEQLAAAIRDEILKRGHQGS